MDELAEMMKMSKEEFAENWENGNIQAKSLELLGATNVVEEEDAQD